MSAGPVDVARQALYRAPLTEFVAERKRLAAELKAAGDKAGAASFAKLGKPSVSAWAVNQLHWHARALLDAMFASAERLRTGDLAAQAAHREAIAALRAKVAAILEGGGHAATEGVVRRVMTTLAALAAAGGFDPDPPGELVDDRDPPGFEVAGAMADLPPRVHAPAPKPATDHAKPASHHAKSTADHAKPVNAAALAAHSDDLARARRDAEAKREAAELEHRHAVEAKRRAAERTRISAALETARGDVKSRERDVEVARKALATAEAAVLRSRTIADDLAAKLADLPRD